MKHLKTKPYILFIPVIIIVFIAFIDEIKAGDFHFIGSEQALGNTIFYCFLIVQLSSLYTLYTFTKKLLYSSVLTWIHTVLTIAFVFILLKTVMGNNGFAGMPRRYYDYSELENFDLFSFRIAQLKINLKILILLVLTQLIYFFNLGIGSFKSVKA
ncbi:MAG: hypothetical protein IT249_15715 [Chitinophagaceae bacterium]|nr:hypothetical protein [Chitinophagaceae bacterium]